MTNQGAPANGYLYATGISASGRFVTMTGVASNLAGGRGKGRVWVHDRESGRTELVSATNDDQPANRISYGGSISASGRLVTFTCATGGAARPGS